jgi:hypothetical protein
MPDDNVDRDLEPNIDESNVEEQIQSQEVKAGMHAYIINDV